MAVEAFHHCMVCGIYRARQITQELPARVLIQKGPEQPVDQYAAKQRIHILVVAADRLPARLTTPCIVCTTLRSLLGGIGLVGDRGVQHGFSTRAARQYKQGSRS
jgi:hypothetical protein